MNEELRIVIKAVTDQAEKDIGEVKGALKGVENSSGAAGAATSKAFSAIATAATVAVAAVAAVGAAVVAATMALSKAAESTADYRKSMAQLTTAFQVNGSSAEQAKKTYSEFYRFLGDTDTAVEASNLLTQLTTNEKDLTQWTKTLQGVYATFPDSLPIEGLVESSNETARVGKVTGNLADALNWAGVSEDEFNAKLANTTTLSEREALIRGTLNDLYGDAAELYEKNAAATLAQNEAQNRMNEALARVGAIAAPVQTSITNLGASFMEALAPAIEAVVPIIVKFINAISKAVGWVTSFINALTGKKETAQVTEQIATGVSNAANASKKLSGGLDSANKAAEQLKKTTAGFDELNVISSGSDSGSSSGSSGGGEAAYATGGVGVGSGITTGLNDALGSTGGVAEEMAAKIGKVFDGLKSKVVNWATLFTPTFEGWKTAFGSVATAWEGTKDRFATAGLSIGNSFLTLGSYLLNDFIPNVTNSISTNLAPILGEIAAFTMEQASLNFEQYALDVSRVTNDIILPILTLLQDVTNGVTEGIANAWANHGAAVLEQLGQFYNGIREIWNSLYDGLLKPIIDALVGHARAIWEESLKPLWDKLTNALGSIMENILIIWNTVLQPVIKWILEKIYPPIKQVINSVLDVLRTMFKTVSSVIGGVIDVIDGIIQFIAGIFTGNWKKAWEGIKKIVTGIWDAIWGVIKGFINMIIDALNLLWRLLYSAIKTVVDLVGDIVGFIGSLFGQDWGFKMPDNPPTIPKLATGGIVETATVAQIGEAGKEAVLPLENNTGWMDTLADRIAARNGAPSKIVLAIDGKELGYATINSINDITKQTGKLQLAYV